MDLPTCPSCHQSVIDDEAEECPFCGASMSGPRQPKPAPTTATKPKAAPKPKSKPKSSSAPAKSSGDSSAPKSDDPFDVQGEKVSKYVRLRVKPKPGREYRVVCPMCETAGYTSEQAAGKPVRCINPDCLMPIFTCPEPEKEPEPEPEKSSGLSAGMLTAIAILLLGGGGFGVWWFVLREDPSIAMQNAAKPGMTDADFERQRKQIEALENPKGNQATEVVATEPEKVTPEELRQSALTEMVKYSEHTPQMGNRDPAYGIQMIASIHAARGDEAAVRKQLARLTKLGVQRPDYRIIPLTDLAWNQISNGQPTAKTLDEALELAGKVRGTGQPDWRAITGLAAVLVAENRADEAADLLSKLRTREDKEVYWAKLQSLRETKNFDFAKQMQHAALVEPADPSRVSVTGTLATHGKSKEALEWANRIQDINSRAEALATWGENVAANQAAQSQLVTLTGFDESLGGLSADVQRSVRTQVHARVARRLATLGQTDLAKTWLAKADTEIASSQTPDARPTPDVKELYDYQIALPWADALELSAIATAEAAAAHRQLGQSDQSKSLVEKTRALIAAITPPLDAMQSLVSEIDQNSASIQNTLGQELNLLTDDQKRTAEKQYRRHAYDLKTAAEKYQALQEVLLAKANGEPAPAVASYQQKIDQVLAEGSVDELADLINSPPRKIGSIQVAEAAMRAASKLLENGKLNEALTYIRRLEQFDPAEDAAEMVGGAAVNVMDAEAVLKAIGESRLMPTRRGAALRGFVVALNAKYPEAPATEEETSEQK
ncbi:hypothetical protein [Thalassoroseus pseudoceratinae]|uniref:hypothetical protein n=1 Tax=Thalassoroseus pseudoceratinae TaxID=2713176 RepID=UPI001421CAAD|nr:hypothetical protein [Thalassoroseus pseudoceratinae]